ncbi:unnamed protein product, partial [Oppiella nova]
MNLSDYFVDNEDDIVISGISGRFPESDTIDELRDNLFANKDLVTEDERRWPRGLYGLPTRSGKLKSLDKFDAQFFGLSGKQADHMDPQGRLLLEVTHEAIVDSGYNPGALRGTNTGVFIGASLAETGESLTSDPTKISGQDFIGTKRHMLSNRVSYTFDLRGPSVSVDSSCSSSLVALQLAYSGMRANEFEMAIVEGPSVSVDSSCSSSLVALQLAYSGMRANEFEMAIVGGVSINLNPTSALELQKLNLLSSDGKCKFLDVTADGFVRSETVSAVVLQKRRFARRVYATVIHAKTNSDGHKEQEITQPSTRSQIELMETALTESSVNPEWVRYVEANGNGIPVADESETNAIYKVYGKKRTDPLLLGSVKSNLGDSEAASGLCSLAKVVITFESRKLPASLHLQRPNPNIKSLVDGSIHPVTENMVFEDSVVAVNSFGFGGTNVQVLLRPNHKSTANAVHVYGGQQYNFEMPRLVLVNGRTRESVDFVLNFIRDHKDRVSDDFLTLLNDVTAGHDDLTRESVDFVLNFIRDHKDRVSDDFLTLLNDVTAGHESNASGFKGYAIRDVSINGFVEKERNVTKSDVRRPLWFILSGMGTQWTGMAKGLMGIEIFNRSVRNSAEILKPFDIDLLQLILSDSDESLMSLLGSSLGTAAVQIALIDILRALDLKADGFIGNSLGELLCGYIDEALDVREVLLFTYWRAKCIEQAKLPRGLMAAVGLSWDEATRRCPAGVVPACHNAPDSVTISGVYEVVDSFLSELKKENVMTKRVNSNDIALHSSQMKTIAPDLLKKLKSVSTSRRQRSHKWISTSVPASNWSTPESQYSSAEYYVNNLTAPVLLQEALQYIPSNAVVVEVSPHSLLKNVVKHSVSAGSYVGLMKRKSADSLHHLLTSLGQLFTLGQNPRIENLYPKISYPVKRGTQSVGALVRWDHSDSHLVPLYPKYFNHKLQSNITIDIDFKEDKNHFYLDHSIDERILFPAAGYLWLVWEEFAKQCGSTRDQLPVIFENVDFKRATIVGKSAHLLFKLDLSQMNGEFSIEESHELIVSGRIRVPKVSEKFLPLRQKVINIQKESEFKYNLSADFIRKELLIRGYNYGHRFRSIVAADMDNCVAKVRSEGNWIEFTEAMLQFLVLLEPTRDLLLVTSIESIHCDPRLFGQNAASGDHKQIVANSMGNYCLAEGLEIYGLGVSRVSRRQHEEELLVEKYVWIPYMDGNGLQKEMRELSECYVEVLVALARNKPKKQSNHRLNELMKRNGIKAEKLVLKDIIESLNINTIKEPPNKQLITADGRKPWTDLLNNLYLEESLLRPAIDIILENYKQSSEEFNVLEINLNQEICYEYVVKYLKNSFYDLRLKYSVYNPLGVNQDSGERIRKQEIRVTNQENNGFEKVDINLTMATKIANTNPLNLVIIRDQYPTPKSDKNVGIDWEDVFRYINTNLKINGFVVILKRMEYTNIEKNLFTRFKFSDTIVGTNQLIESAQKFSNLLLVSNRGDTEGLRTSAVLLFRKIDAIRNPGTSDAIIRVTHQDLSPWFEPLKNEMKVESDRNPERLIWLISDSGDGSDTSSGIVGFVNCLRREPGGHRVRCISALELEDLRSASAVTVKELIDSSIFDNNLVMNIYKNNELGSYRYLSLNMDHLTKSGCNHAMVIRSNNTSNVQWFESKHNLWTESQLNSEHNSLITVYYAGLNASEKRFKSDKSIVKSARNTGLCSEFSGVDVQSGSRVLGIKPNACLATTLAFNNKNDYIQVPDKWTMAEACTVPMAYGTVYWALVVRAQLQSLQTVLVHSADGYMGRAAIAVCLSRHSEVYVTVGTVDEKKELMVEFPDLDDTHVINTSVDCFKQIVIENTGAKGVDIVFNYTNEYKLETSLSCIRSNGRYIEITSNDTSIAKGLFIEQNITIDKINLEDIFTESTDDSVNTSVKYQVLSLLEEGISDNVVKPFKTSKVFNVEKANEALEYLLKSGHKRKVLVRVRQEIVADLDPEDVDGLNAKIEAIHRTQFSSDLSFIITGGLNDFGLELSQWLVWRGARHLVLTSGSDVKNEFQELIVKRLTSLGANVLISRVDTSNEEELEAMIKEAANMGSVCGIFSVAMVLSDSLFEDQTQESMTEVLTPKVQTISHLDVLSRVLCPELQYFVAISSVSSGRGTAGQSNYGYANSYVERVCEQRHSDGLPGLAIQWRPIYEVRVMDDRYLTGDNPQVIGGTVPQSIHSCLALLNHLMRSSESVVSSVLRSETQSNQKSTINGLIASILGIRDMSKITNKSKLSELGMDSLMAVEIKQSLEQEFRLSLTLQQLSDITF